LSAVKNCAKFYAYKDIIAPAFDGFAYQQLIMSAAVKVTGIQEIDAAVSCLLNGGDALPFIICRAAPYGRHTHTTQSEFGHEWSVVAQGYLCYCCHCCFVINDTKIGCYTAWPVSLMAQFTCLYGSSLQLLQVCSCSKCAVGSPGTQDKKPFATAVREH